MNRLQPNGNFQLVRKLLLEFDQLAVTQAGVIFNDDRLEGSHDFSNLLAIIQRDSLAVKKVAAVVELDVGDPRASWVSWINTQLSQSRAYLAGDSSDRHALGRGVLPEVAHQATERAFAVGQQQGGNVFHDSCCRRLCFQ